MNKKTLCQYCHQPLQRLECACYDDEDSEYISIHACKGGVLWFLSLFLPSYKKRLEEHRFKITCANEECIGYLDGCMVNKRNSFSLSWKYSWR